MLKQQFIPCPLCGAPRLTCSPGSFTACFPHRKLPLSLSIMLDRATAVRTQNWTLPIQMLPVARNQATGQLWGTTRGFCPITRDHTFTPSSSFTLFHSYAHGWWRRRCPTVDKRTSLLLDCVTSNTDLCPPSFSATAGKSSAPCKYSAFCICPFVLQREALFQKTSFAVLDTHIFM